MKFESRKLYAHGQNDKVFLLQIPKLICTDMGLTKDTLVDMEYNDGQIIITKIKDQFQDEQTERS
ncbi:MAG: hypothetical protein NC408_03345 [Candidatus Gastranaerophilales bacterium]|nr:hypothetical protein [Candidatus Gastranaerophilales bacterium]MCM1073028.1 hypothetical protein [Bacteroides sp.]